MSQHLKDNANRSSRKPSDLAGSQGEPDPAFTGPSEYPQGDLGDSPDKQMQVIQLLKKSRREFLMVFDSVPAMIWYRDPEGKILRVNQCAADSVNRSISELVGKNYYDLFPDGAERSRQQDLQVIQSGQPLRGQLRRFKAFDGKTHWAMVDRIPLRDKKAGKIAGVMVFAQDISDQKNAEDHLVRAKKEIEIRNTQLKAAAEKARQLADQADRSNRAKSEVLASSSHDLRTPMNAIIGFSELLIETELDDEQAEYIKTINQSAVGLLSLINDILDYTKLEAGKLNVQIASCNIKEFLDEIQAMMASGARQKGLDFKVQIDTSLPDEFFTDPVRLKQCMINLIGNAVKFTHQGHVGIHVKRHLKGSQSCICFDVEDTGIGIAADKQAEIFQPYSQAEETTEQAYGGTGLGLAITRKLAGLLGGHLSVASESGKGSVFSVVLPLFTEAQRSASPFARADKPRRIDDAERSAQGCILLAENNVPSQLTMNLLLRRVGMDVEVAAGADDLFDKAANTDVDMILLDLEFDCGQGMEIIRRLRNNKIDVPVIVIADCDLAMMEEALAAGCNKYLTKPVFRRELYEAVEEMKAQVAFEARFEDNDTSLEAAELSNGENELFAEEMSEALAGIFDPQELTQLLPELLDELRKAMADAAGQQAQQVIDVLCKVAAGTNAEIIDKVNELAAHYHEKPDLTEQADRLINQLETLCDQIPACDDTTAL